MRWHWTAERELSWDGLMAAVVAQERYPEFLVGRPGPPETEEVRAQRADRGQSL